MPYSSTLKRIAILIGSPDTRFGVLPGVRADIRRYCNFLLSNFGGAWEEHEIVVLNNPREREVNLQLARARSCHYAFVVFSGHGFHAESTVISDTQIVLNDSESMPVNRLDPGNSRHTVVVDACRNVVFIEEDMTKMAGLGEMYPCVGTDRLSCRLLFDGCVKEAGEGRVELYSCDIGQLAVETSAGGFFSRYLVQDAVSSCQEARSQGALLVERAFEMVREDVFHIDMSQTPVMQKSSGAGDFPFAVVA